MTDCGKYYRTENDIILTSQKIPAWTWAQIGENEQRSYAEVEAELDRLDKAHNKSPGYYEKGSCGYNKSCAELNTEINRELEQQIIDGYIIDQVFK